MCVDEGREEGLTHSEQYKKKHKGLSPLPQACLSWEAPPPLQL